MGLSSSLACLISIDTRELLAAQFSEAFLLLLCKSLGFDHGVPMLLINLFITAEDMLWEPGLELGIYAGDPELVHVFL